MSLKLYGELKTFAQEFVFDAADSRFWGKIFLEIKHARHKDFKILGINDPTAGVRFFENFVPILGLLLETLVDIGFATFGVLDEGNLLSFLALVVSVISLPAGGLILSSRRWLVTQDVISHSWLTILLVSSIDLSDSLFILSLDDDDNLLGLAAALVPILNPVFVLTVTCLWRQQDIVSDITLIHAASSFLKLILHGLVAKLRPLALAVELEFLESNSTDNIDVAVADDYVLIVSLLCLSLIGTWFTTVEYTRIILLPETKVSALTQNLSPDCLCSWGYP